MAGQARPESTHRFHILKQAGNGRKKNKIQQKIEEVGDAGNFVVTSTLEVSTTVARKEKTALLGYSIGQLGEGNGSYTRRFGSWNDRPRNEGEARKLLNSLRDGVRRYARETVIKVPVDVKHDIKPEMLEKLKKTIHLTAEELAQGSAHELLLEISQYLVDPTAILDLIGGQHRDRAVTLYLREVEGERNKLARDLIDLEEQLATVAAPSAQADELQRNIKATKELIQEKTTELNHGGNWLFALYDKCE